MKKNLLLIAFALLAGQGFAQNLDSLLVVREVDSLMNAANNLQKAGKKEQALSLVQEAADKSKLQWGEENALYASCLHLQATIYLAMRQYDKSEEMNLRAIELRRKILGEEHPDYIQSLISLAGLYDRKALFGKAEEVYLEVAAIQEKTVGKENKDYALTLYSLGYLARRQGDASKAVALYQRSVTILDKTLGKETAEYIFALNGLGNAYDNIGDYSLAEQCYLESAAIGATLLGKESAHYASSLYYLAILYKNKGDFEKSEPLHLEVIAIRAKIFGKTSSEYADVLNSFASLSRMKGEYAKAEQIYLESKSIREMIFGKDHLLYAQSLNNLANLYYSQGQYEKVEPLYIECNEIRAKTLGRENPEFAVGLCNLATLYLTQGKYAQAEQLVLLTKDALAKSVGTGRPEYAKTLQNLAEIAQFKKDYSQAAEFYSESMSSMKKIYGRDNYYICDILNDLAKLYLETSKLSESATCFMELNAINRRLIEQEMAYSSENQMLAYLSTFDIPTGQFQSFNQTYPKAEVNGANYDNAIFLNGLLLENARKLARSVANTDDTTRQTYERWQGCRRRLAKEYAKPIAERRFVTEVEAEAEGYEKTLARNLPVFSETRHAPRWQEVQAALKPGETAIEFTHYGYYKLEVTDSTMYAALVLRPGDTSPQFIPLFEKNELKELLRGASGGGNHLKINELYSQKSLYNLVWKPLEPLLTGVKTVYCAPSGLLHRLNLAAMATPEGKVYGERRQLVVLGSTRSLAVGTKASQLVIPNNNNNQTNTNTAYLAGGIRYDTDSTAIAYANRGASSRSVKPGDLTFQPDSLSITRGGVLEYLPATAAEVHEIGQTLSAASFQTKVDTGFYATEESFRKLGIDLLSPRIIHLATHGYFFPDPVASGTRQSTPGRESVFKMSDHPMIRSGMILAGAKQAWLTGKHPEGQEDGILTAYEISQMNLSGTELVVLSACETGLGDIIGNEGVYGLQRAFKIAGAKYLIMSLWKVDDKSTQAFMTSFYRHWLTEKQTVPQAFRATQREMRSKYSGAFDWAGFVLIE